MKRWRPIWPEGRRWTRTALGVVLATVLATVLPALIPFGWPRASRADIPTVAVRRTDLQAVVKAGGRLESSHSTEIRCTLERLAVPGKSLPAGEASMIISVIPEGTTVKRGDILCEMDSSDYQ